MTGQLMGSSARHLMGHADADGGRHLDQFSKTQKEGETSKFAPSEN